MIAPHPCRPAVRRLLLVTLLLGLASAVRGQALESVPLNVESLGLSFRPPAGASVRLDQSGAVASIVLVDSDAAPSWTLRVTRLVSTLENPTARGQIDDHLRRMRERGEAFEVIRSAPSTFGGREGHICYINQTLGEQRAVSGWLVIPTGGPNFLVFSLVTTPELLDVVRPAVEASYATIRVTDTDEVDATRVSRLDAGTALVASITEPDLRRLVGLRQWARIHRPGADTGAETEVGYSLIEVMEAKRGLLNPGRAEENYTPVDQQDGLVVRVQGRVVVDPARQDYFDSIALYWLAWDQSEEGWSIRATRRMGEAQRTEAETGLRTSATTGSPVPKLIVIKGDDALRNRDTFEWNVPQPYLSQALGWVLGPVLAARAAGEGEFAYGFYNLSRGEPGLSERIDQWRRRPDGTFELVTRLSPDAVPYSSVYRADGALVRRTREDGTLTVPSDPQTIRRLWETKGLRFGG